MTDQQLHRDIGRLEATVKAQEGRIASMAVEQKEMADQVKEMHEILLQAKGGWKTLVTVGAISSAVTTAVIKLIATFKAGS